MYKVKTKKYNKKSVNIKLLKVKRKTVKRYFCVLISTLIMICNASVAIASIQGPVLILQEKAPEDQVKEHVEVINLQDAQYNIEFAGTVDGTMTRSPIGYYPFDQGFQPNIRLRMENIGETDIINPWVTINGKRNWRTIQDIVAEATKGCITDREKAIAIWNFHQNNKFHSTTWDKEVDDPVKMYNVYGFTICDNDSKVLADLMRTAGLKTRAGHQMGHTTTEVFFDGEYHLLDGDEGLIALMRDNKSIAGEEQLAHDHDLINRTHTYGILAEDSKYRDELTAAYHNYDTGETERVYDYPSNIGHTMDFKLRPNEWIEWRWDNVGKQYSAGIPFQNVVSNSNSSLIDKAYRTLRNGYMHYAPDLKSAITQRGTEEYNNIRFGNNVNEPVICLSDSNQPGRVVWKIQSPYVMVGGKINISSLCGDGDSINVEISPDGIRWKQISTIDSGTGSTKTIDFDSSLSPQGEPQYEYYVAINLFDGGAPSPVGLNSISFDTDLQMAPLSLPELEVGNNVIKYHDETAGERNVRITHEWIERKTMTPPPAPISPSYPQDGGTASGTKFAFSWNMPEGSTNVADYQFQLSEYNDMRWPLSPNFNRLISLTADKGKSQYTIPDTGLLNPNQTYYWRVRVKDVNGVWGPWSSIWSFNCQAPGIPTNVTAISDQAKGTVKLVWSANPEGTSPAKYKIYGSNEKGFHASDNSYLKLAPSSQNPMGMMIEAPSNLIAETDKCEAVVAGPDAISQNLYYSYYRIVAVDESGLESGLSDYAEVSRPFIYTVPPFNAVVGQVYSYLPFSLLSDGHPTLEEATNLAIRNKETVTFTLEDAPGWLNVNPATGEIYGKPSVSGSYNVVLRATNYFGRVARQSFNIDVTQSSAVSSVSLKTNLTNPQNAGIPITITADSTGSSDPQYKFWLKKDGKWSILKDYGPENSIVWTPNEEGQYILAVYARDSGSSEISQAYGEISYTIGSNSDQLATPVTSVYLGTNVLSPQNVGTSITINAVSQGSLNPYYKFWIKQDGVWQVLKDYSAESNVIWRPVKPGRYILAVYAKDKNAYESVQAYYEMNFYIGDIFNTPVTSVFLNTGPLSPQKAGTAVIITASSQGSLNPYYKFWINKDGQWSMLKNYGPEYSIVWTPQSEGEYTLAVYARDSRSGKDVEAYKEINYVIKNELVEETTPVTSASLIASPESAQPVSTTVTLTASSVGSTNPYYKFWVYKDGQWSMLKDYGPESTITWTPASEGNYILAIYARDKYATSACEAYYQINYMIADNITPITSADLTANPGSPQRVGTPITVKATSVGSDSPRYKFWIKKDGQWSMLKDYGPEDSIVWTPQSEGEYALAVYVRDSRSGKDVESYKEINYIIKNDFVEETTPVTSASLVVSSESAQTVGIAVTLTASSVGSNNPYYKFWVYKDGQWNMLKDYGPESTITWTPASEGNYILAIYARDKYATSACEAYYQIDLIVSNRFQAGAVIGQY